MLSQSEKHGVRINKPGKACQGYTLVNPFGSGDVFLIDMEGNYLHHWGFNTIPRDDGRLLQNGNLLYTKAAPLPPEDDMSHPRIGGWGIGGGIVEVDWEGNVVWEYVDSLQNHSVWRMRNGNTIYPVSLPVDKDIAAEVRGGYPGSEDRGMIWTDGFHEVTPSGELVWEWNASHHLDVKRHVLCPVCPRGDWTHMNSIQELSNGDILTSMRNISTICIVDKATGRIKWDWGPGEISHQHAPMQLDNGNILLFDNGAHRQDGLSISYSRVIEVNPETNKIEWEYKADPPQSFYSSLISNAQRLANGNTLICEGIKGRIFEVTMEGETVWEYLNPFYPPQAALIGGKISPTSQASSRVVSNAIFRAYRYAPDYPGLKDKKLSRDELTWLNGVYGPGSLE